MITGILHNRGLAIHQADTGIPKSRLCFPAFVLELKKRMAERLAGAWL
jgi:hypothetical protein